MTGMLVSCGDNGNGGPGGSGRAGGPGGWGQGSGTATSVETETVTSSSISARVRSFGSIRAQDVVSIIPQVSNRITEIHADLGDTVRQGEVMARIYDVPFRDALEQARAQLRQSRSAFERDSTTYVRQQQLFERGASSQSEYDDARSTYESSRAQLESARAALTQSRENLQNTEIRSPVEGVVLNRMIAEGDLARTGEPAFEVANLVGYETRLFLPMQDWETVSIGLPVTMSLSNREGVAAEGTISRISPQLNPNSGLGEVVVSLVDVTPSIRQGVLVEANITLYTHENTIVIPRSAMIEQIDTYIEPETNTVEIQRSYNAFVAVGDTTAEQRELELGLEQGERVEVIAGLQEGEELIVTGQRNLSDGSRIRVPAQRRPDATGEQRLEDGPPANGQPAGPYDESSEDENDQNGMQHADSEDAEPNRDEASASGDDSAPGDGSGRGDGSGSGEGQGQGRGQGQSTGGNR